MSDSFQILKSMVWLVCGAVLLTLGVVSSGQTTPSPIAPLHEGWEAIDERFVFLTVELSSTEASMNAVNNALVAAGRDQAVAKQHAANYADGNTRMDRQGGGPMSWQDFYGKTAASFYYHSSASIDVQGQSNFQLHAQAQGKTLTSLNRPPQFDYIYRANADARKHAESDAASLGNRIDQLLARRRELEAEQSTLWCKIALRGLASRDLSLRPLYRYDLPASPADKQSTQRFAAISAECRFMRTINSLIKQAQPALDGDQAPVYAQLQQAVASARDDLEASLMNLPILADALTDAQSYTGQFTAAAKRLDDLSQNLVDAYRLAGDGERANDDQRKDSFRAQFQQTIMDFSATVLTADQALTAQAAEWNITPDISHRITADPNAKPLIVRTEAVPVAPAPVAPSPSSSVDPKSNNPPAVQPNNPPEVQTANAGNDQPIAQPPSAPDMKAINAERSAITAAQTRILDSTPFDSDQHLSQVDRPYEIKDVFHPAADGENSLKIVVGPGVEIRGGKIDLGRKSKNADISLEGTASNPIILRNVEIDQPLGSKFNAVHVVFDQCTFRKIGGWFSYYSSKWPMDQCLLYKCKFPSFKAVDYGFQFMNCTFVGMDLPEITHKNGQDEGFDYMSRLRRRWNIIKLCNFVDCTIYPTVFWCSEQSNFWNCQFTPGAAFKSDMPTTVLAFVHGVTGDTPDQINQANPPEQAPLTIRLQEVPFPVYRWGTNCPIPELRHDDHFAGIILSSAESR